MTLSILAFDRDSETVGAAVTSCVLAAGRRVLAVRPSVGAAAVQFFSEITWAEETLDALAAGASPAAGIRPFVRDDTQIAAMGFTGETAVHTGEACHDHKGHHSSTGLSIQVNTADRADAVARMLSAFEQCAGQPLAERLVAALAASGDDARGRQSAAVLVTGRTALGGYVNEPHVDLRVDDHRDPVGELARLLDLHRCHNAMRKAFEDPEGHVASVVAPRLARHPDDPHLKRAAGRSDQ